MSTHEEAATPTPEGRDSNGRFVRGNAGGPGNPFARQVAQLRSLLLRALTAEDLVAVAVALVERAKQGDVAAARLLFQYTLGKPLHAAHPDRVDADELQAFRENTAPSNVLDHLLSVPVEPALELMRVLLPAASDNFRQEFHDQFVHRYGEDGRGGSFAREQATVNKRPPAGRPATDGADPPSAVRETETIRLVNEPGPTASPPDARAANKRRP
ncbi:MAG: hypothetical protein U0797_27870 [Gemmataceae bacterium]